MSPRKAQKRPRRVKRKPPERRDIKPEDLDAILERAERGPLATEDVVTLRAALETLAWITEQLEDKTMRLAKLRRLLFGPSSERSKDVLAGLHGAGEGSGGDARADAPDGEPVGAGAEGSSENGGEGVEPSAAEGEPDAGADAAGEETKKKKKSKPGHGRNGADAYPGAEPVSVPNGALKPNDPCPKCDEGKLYRKKPSVLIRIKGIAPLHAFRYELERLRCGLCGAVFTASAPPGVGDVKYDESASAMIALLRYGCGLPHNRLARLGDDLGIPMPSATQWDVLAKASKPFEPVHQELVRIAADGQVLHNDDTNAMVLSLDAMIREEIARGEKDRTGIFTSGVVSKSCEHEIVLFFTGREHAGENLKKVLAQRSAELAPPIQMCDALARNNPPDFDTMLANCMAHARRNFVDVAHSFPEHVAHVLEELRKVFVNEAFTKKEAMTAQQRLLYHQEHSGPVMEQLGAWLTAQLDQRKVEDNSPLGGAIRYMENHWDELTLFLRVPGAPIDNNLCERILKRAIVHRKNSLFYKTENGARIGDMFMSLIATAERTGANVFDYLVAVQRNAHHVHEHPEQWMPWNYLETLVALRADGT
jgi:transposase